MDAKKKHYFDDSMRHFPPPPSLTWTILSRSPETLSGLNLPVEHGVILVAGDDLAPLDEAD